MLIKSSDEYYLRDEKRIIKYVIKGTRCIDLEKLEIMDDAMMILKIKHNKVISDKNRKEQFINLAFYN